MIFRNNNWLFWQCVQSEGFCLDFLQLFLQPFGVGMKWVPPWCHFLWMHTELCLLFSFKHRRPKKHLNDFFSSAPLAERVWDPRGPFGSTVTQRVRNIQISSSWTLLGRWIRWTKVSNHNLRKWKTAESQNFHFLEPLACVCWMSSSFCSIPTASAWKESLLVVTCNEWTGECKQPTNSLIFPNRNQLIRHSLPPSSLLAWPYMKVITTIFRDNNWTRSCLWSVPRESTCFFCL